MSDSLVLEIEKTTKCDYFFLVAFFFVAAFLGAAFFFVAAFLGAAFLGAAAFFGAAFFFVAAFLGAAFLGAAFFGAAAFFFGAAFFVAAFFVAFFLAMETPPSKSFKSVKTDALLLGRVRLTFTLPNPSRYANRGEPTVIVMTNDESMLHEFAKP